MERGKWVAILTGVFSALLGLAYLGLVQVLEWAGGMLPPPPEALGVLGW
ncbi:MAG: hypothetical protein HC918_05465 [Oscillatoriales cyanobacterium SM2_1_8]|nr:hypothetical protein [Oscillatoriales cyanobacterium SM2_1_8]